MIIGNSADLNLFALNNRSLLRTKIKMEMNGANGANSQGKSPIQPRPTLEVPDDFDPNAHKRRFHTIGELGSGLIELGWTWEKVEARAWYHDPVNYATAFLHGREGRYGSIGVGAIRQILGEQGIELPENARFDISMNRYGRVTITGLEDADLTRGIEEALSSYSRVSSLLATFVHSAKVLQGHNPRDIRVFTAEQQRLLTTQSDLMGFGVGLHDLSLDANGRIAGLPQELYDRIYGDRTAWLSGMEEMEAKWENWNINRIRDNILHFLRNGTAHVPAPDISMTFYNGRMIVGGDAPPPGSVFKMTL